MKAGEAALFAVLVLGVLVAGAAAIIRAATRNPQRDSELEIQQDLALQRGALIDAIYAYTTGIRDVDEVADYVAGMVEQYRRTSK